MNLEEFISQTLLDITQGIEKANKVSNRFQLSGQIHQRGVSGESVEFDVGLQVSHSKQKGGKGGISVASVGIKGEANSVDGYESTHRLKFKLFVTEQ